MNKEFTPYEQALELKELGFDEVCIAGYDGDDNSLYIGYISNEGVQYNPQYYTKAPLYQQAFRWLREKYKIVHEIQFGSGKIWIRYGHNSFVRALKVDNNNNEFYHTYEEAELACLKKLIEIIKDK